MTALDLIVRPKKAPAARGFDQVADSHSTSARSAKMYTRFFGQENVLMHDAAHTEMLRDTLATLVAQRPDLAQIQGIAIYAKTQTHSVPFESDWLQAIFDDLGLGQWEVLTLSMTNCASSLAAVHAFSSLDLPIIVISGEKAFHSASNRLSVGLLGEAPIAALFDAEGRRPVVATKVRHLPRFFLNPDDMEQEDKRALQTAFEEGFTDFMHALVSENAAFFDREPIMVPYNLNVPLVSRLLDRLGMADRLIDGHSGSFGHTFCSDNFLNLDLYPVAEQRPICLFCAGMGITYAAVLLDAAACDEDPSNPNLGDDQ